MGEGDEEAAQTELANVQTAVTALLFANRATSLTSSHTGVDSETECQAVMATGGSDNLTTYLMGGEYPLTQSYTIATDGSVTAE